jgi:hypothetical protein
MGLLSVRAASTDVTYVNADAVPAGDFGEASFNIRHGFGR